VATAWLRELSRVLFEDKVDEALFRRLWEQRNVQQPMLNILRNPDGLGAFWCDDTRTAPREDCDDAVGIAWKRAIADLSRRYGDDPAHWHWGQAHAARSEHKPFAKVPALAGFFDVKVPTGGDTYTVNVGRHNLRDDVAPFESVHAASLRAIYDLADLDASRFIASTGQSGNVVSSHYRDWAEHWALGQYIRMGRDRVRDGDTLVLEPAQTLR
jgi:penicillin amidase